MLRAADLTCRFGRAEVLRGVSLQVPRGGITGILGPNGSGKTTLLRLLAGALPPTSGEVRLDDVPVASIPKRQLARRLAVVPQEIHPVFDYTVLDLALMGRYAHLGPFGFETAGDLLAVRRALAATGTADLECRHFDTLSGGEKQRVVIASALAQFDEDTNDEGRLLILDEPTAALDLHYQFEVAHLLRHLAEARHLTLLVTTHDLQFAWQVCDRVVLLQDGRVLADGPTVDTLTPEHLRALYGVQVDRMTHPDGTVSLVPVSLVGARR
ncbi:ABC transporter ATP-binding protein [Luteitalea sp. TBR-22]|uniref:ABC transporter ATP-binding protein n=1 Tax=Luteitalea sp. TBR-22 TaxID=2802971 RepID=UPI001AF8807E|nr:ABC transporter ATP-binding protein [Luteitalea sp. TBR-22]